MREGRSLSGGARAWFCVAKLEEEEKKDMERRESGMGLRSRRRWRLFRDEGSMAERKTRGEARQ